MRISRLMKAVQDIMYSRVNENSNQSSQESQVHDNHLVNLYQSTNLIYESVQKYTMTSRERVAHLCYDIDYVVNAEISGAIVECGVWRGGSIMAAILRLQSLGIDVRDIYLYDTFEGMTPPQDIDIDFRGDAASKLLQQSDKYTSNVWAHCSFDDVHSNVGSVNSDLGRINFLKGKVEDNLEKHGPEQIALLRLDTYWYQSTYHELNIFYPRLTKGGVLIVDDYGHWRGAKKAVDDYIANNSLKLFLVPIDYTGRIAVKVD